MGALDKSDYSFASGENQLPAGSDGGRNWFENSNEFTALTGPLPAGASSDARPLLVSAAGDQQAKAQPAELLAKMEIANAPPLISEEASRDAIRHTIEKGVHTFDLLPLLAGDRRAVFFGERHDDPGQKDEIIKNLQELKDKDGLTHVALEMLNNADMPAVRGYFNGTGSREAVLDRLKLRWSVTPDAPEKYMQLIDAIKAAKLTPLALDQELGGRDDNHGTLFEDRNQHWAEVVGTVLKGNSKTKVLVYTGRDHVGYGGVAHANEILKTDYGQDSSVVVMASQKDKPGSLSLRVAQAASDLHINKSQFALAISPSAPHRPGDYVLHVPE